MHSFLSIHACFFSRFTLLDQIFRQLTQPARSTLLLGTAADLPLTRAQLIAENALLCQQLIVLQRQVKNPHLTRGERLWFLFLATCLPNWQETLPIFQPETCSAGIARDSASPGISNPAIEAVVPSCLPRRLS